MEIEEIVQKSKETQALKEASTTLYAIEDGICGCINPDTGDECGRERGHTSTYFKPSDVHYSYDSDHYRQWDVGYATQQSALRNRGPLAMNILDSEPFMWIMAGSNHLESQLDALRDAWKQYRDLGGGYNNRE